MKEIHLTSKAKKDLKRYKHKKEKYRNYTYGFSFGIIW